MAEELCFLDWAGCSPEDQAFLRNVLLSPSTDGVTFPWSSSEPPPKGGDKATPGAGGGTGECFQPTYAISAFPNVYINNVTANVNVHHVPPAQQPTAPRHDEQAPPPAAPPPQQPPQQHIVQQQQQQQPPQFMPQQPATAPGYIVPFSTPQQQPQPTAAAMEQYYKAPPHHPQLVIPPAVHYPPLYHPAAPFVTLSLPPTVPAPYHQLPARPPASFASPVPLVPPPVVPVTTQIPQHMIPPVTGMIIPQQVNIPQAKEPQPPPPPPVEQAPVAPPPPEQPVVVPVQEVKEETEPEPEKPVEVQEEETVEVPEEAPKPKETEEQEEKDAAPVQKSWASLFKKDTPSAPAFDAGAIKKPTAMIQPFTEIVAEEETKTVKEASDELGAVLASHLQAYKLNHKAPSIKPRGLSNRSNWCFVNAILQALIACPPFYNMIKSLPPAIKEYNNSNVNILRALYEFVSEFSPMEYFPKPHKRDKKKTDDLPIGPTFEASSVFKMLLELTSDAFKVIDGRQEDAEEFLTFLLNGINDEMLALFKMIEKPDEEEGEAEVENNDEDWKEVGPKNKSCLTRRQNTTTPTPLAEMVQGQIRSCVQQAAGEPTATLQPFFSLQLDIQHGDVKSVSEALVNNFTLEVLDGYVCSKTKQEVEASRSLSLEELPPILVLHLKRFVYMSGGCQKLLKNIEFPIDLEILREILSPNSKNKYQAKQRQYKLFAVVYHNGSEATKGHYVSDVYHTGLASWLRCDDSQVKSVSEQTVLQQAQGTGNSMPYILFYRRGDTMVGLDKPAK